MEHMFAKLVGLPDGMGAGLQTLFSRAVSPLNR